MTPRITSSLSVLLLLAGALLWAKGVSTVAASDFAGEYYHGDGLGTNCLLNLGLRGAFHFRESGCTGTHGENEGSYQLQDGVVILWPRRENDPNGLGGTPTRFLIVKWGERRYLVAEDNVLEFCNDINQRGEPRSDVHGRHYLRDGDEKKPVCGFPDLPEQWKEYLMNETLEGHVIAADHDQSGVVNLGSKQGLKVGMMLTASGRHVDFIQLRVTAVKEEIARVKKEYEFDKDEKIEVGHSVSTSFWSRHEGRHRRR